MDTKYLTGALLPGTPGSIAIGSVGADATVISRSPPPDIIAKDPPPLQSDSWPGNVRELENMTRRLLLGARGLSIKADAVRQTLAARHTKAGPIRKTFAACAGELLTRAQKGELQDAHARMLAEAEREILTQAITLAEGNQAKARAGWGYPDLPCAKNSSNLACIQTPPRPTRKRTAKQNSRCRLNSEKGYG